MEKSDDWIDSCLKLEKLAGIKFVRSVVAPTKSQKYWKAWDKFYSQYVEEFKKEDDEITIPLLEKFESLYYNL